jgi:catechol 2,3-dioxygenase-like lactoylglutathione lyase family enzyme
MFSHIMVGNSELDKSKGFYDAVMATLGVGPGMAFGDRVFYSSPGGNFAVTKPINGQPASSANGGTIAFSCSSPVQVNAWHAAGVASGGASCEDPPGLRENAAGKLYLAYLRDPDGNKLCAMHRPG